jgi:phosphate transport system substrate-binding protein
MVMGLGRRFGLLAVALSAIAGCSKGGAGGSGSGAAASSGKGAATVTVDGSSTVYMLTKAVVEEFAGETGGKIKVTAAYAGTGGGFKKFGNGEIDIAGASRPITAEEIELCKKNGVEYVELPVCFDALTVAVNPQATWLDSIKVSELKKIWEPAAKDTVKLWSDVRPEWPKEPFALFGAGSDSGTFEYFTEAVVEQKKASRGDYTASENDNTLVIGIAGNKHALGYIPYAYFVESKDKLKALAIEWDKNGQPAVAPTVEAVLEAKYNPLSRPLFIYVNKKSAARPEVKQFVDYYLAHAKQLSADVHFIPLTDKAYEVSAARFKGLKTGTGYGGKAAIGLKLEEVLAHEPKN